MRRRVGQLHRSFIIPVAMQKTLPGTSVTSGASQGPHTVFVCAIGMPGAIPYLSRTIPSKTAGHKTCNSWPQLTIFKWGFQMQEHVNQLGRMSMYAKQEYISPPPPPRVCNSPHTSTLLSRQNFNLTSLFMTQCSLHQ